VKGLLTVLVLYAFFSAQAYASTLSVSATVDKNEATLEDYIVLKISVQGTRNQPVLPSMAPFKVESRGSSSQVRIINGQMSSSIEYNYLLLPTKPGVFTIGPCTVEDKGKTAASNKITLQILKQQQQTKKSRLLFVTAEVDNDKPYLYEQIVYILKFYRSVKVANARLTKMPAFEGFITEDLGKEKEYQRIINGQSYVVTEIKRALFPAKTGVLEITPAVLNCDVVVQKRRQRRGMFGDPFFNDSFFGFSETKPKVLRTEPVTVMVASLPAEKKPAGFENLVGNFSLRTNLGKKKLEVGESVTLTLTLEGTGNLKSHQTITMGSLQNFKVYDDKPVFKPGIFGSKVGGKLTIKKALVPLVEGSLKIPLLTIPYFDPDSGSYKRATAGPYMLSVSPSAEKEKLQVVTTMNTAGSKEEVKIIGHDILPIHTSLDALSPHRANPLSWVSTVLFVVPFLSFMGFFAAKRFKQRYEQDRGLARAQNAYRVFKKKLPGIKRAVKAEDAAFCSTGQKALKDFIGDKLNVAGSALTAGELERLLSGTAVSDDAVRELKKIFEFFETGQFGFKNYSVSEREAVFFGLKKLAAQLNKKIKR